MMQTGDYKLESIDSIGRLPLSEQVYITLRQAILTGSLEADTKLNEVKIAEQLNVSATPVREAFRKLAKDGLVVIRPWKGVTVKGYTPEEIISMYQCREVMEGLGARLCAENATDEQLQELKDVYDEWNTAKEPQLKAELNMHLHNLIMHYSHNERITEYLIGFKEMVNKDMYESAQNEDRLCTCNKEHAGIVEAILARNGQLAEERMRYHIREAFNFKKQQANIE